jgi:hypothetical protein
MSGGTANHYAGWSRLLEALPSSAATGSWTLAVRAGRSAAVLSPCLQRNGARPLSTIGRWTESGVGKRRPGGQRLASGVIQITTGIRECAIAMRRGYPHGASVPVGHRRRLTLAEDGTRLTGVDVATLSGRRFEPRRVYVLAGWTKRRGCCWPRRMPCERTESETSTIWSGATMEHLNSRGAAVSAAPGGVRASGAARWWQRSRAMPRSRCSGISPRLASYRCATRASMEITLSAMPIPILDQLRGPGHHRAALRARLKDVVTLVSERLTRRGWWQSSRRIHRAASRW